jgi:hypothetical protein
MRVRLRAGSIIPDPVPDWVRPDQQYEAEWSDKMTSPRRVVLIHPDRPDTFYEVPFRAVDLLAGHEL